MLTTDRLVFALIAVAAMLLLAGCSIGDDPAPAPGEDAALLVVTADHGTEELLRRPVAPGRSALRTLRDEVPISTEFGGGFVSEVFGRRSDPGGRRDWFFFVDGILSPVGARQARVPARGHLWWDHRSWAAIRDPWAVVGAWPAPFVRNPTAADPPLAAVLRGAGGRVVADSEWRVIVGSDRELRRRDAAWRRAAGDPRGAGMTAWIDGARVMALEEDGADFRPVSGGVAIAVAVPSGADVAAGVVMAVAGIDSGAAQTAAQAIADRPMLTAERYAVVFGADGTPLTGWGGAPS